MTTVIKLRDIRRHRAHGQTLCRAGFHKWRPVTARRFDVKRGQLLTVECCARCDRERVRLT
jgi:hypothetical protein